MGSIFAFQTEVDVQNLVAEIKKRGWKVMLNSTLRISLALDAVKASKPLKALNIDVV